MGASQAWSPALTDHSLPRPGPPARAVGVMPAASLLPGLNGSTLQRQPRQWAKGRDRETGGSPQAGGGLGGRGPVCLDLTQHLHLVLLWPHLQGKGRWRHREAERQMQEGATLGVPGSGSFHPTGNPRDSSLPANSKSLSGSRQILPATLKTEVRQHWLAPLHR